jgi:hypothetical protein
LAAVTGTESSSGGELSSSHVFPMFSSRTPASKIFGFPPSPALDLGFPANLAPSGPVFKFTPLETLQIPKTFSAPPSLAGAGARLANRFLFLCLRIVFENKNKKLFSVVFSLKKCLADCFQK